MTTSEVNTRPPALRLEGIVKQFPGVRALDQVSFSVMPGEVHALMGENGAGKSTLMKVLGGLHQPDAGQILVDEEAVVMSSPLNAKARGIVFVHQELSLSESLNVAENVYLGELPRNGMGLVKWGELYRNTDAILKKLNVKFNARTPVSQLSIANKQMVEIARALTVNAKAVIFDEPTASLTDAEKFVLFQVIADLQSQGVGIIYISHRMEEIFKIADRISILRDGQYRGTLQAKETNEDEVTHMMIGRELNLSRLETPELPEEAILDVRNLSVPGKFDNVSFTLRRGEVLGFYGLVGAGRTEVAETLFGLHKPSAGEILIQGKAAAIRSPDEAMKHGISLVPEDRKLQGLVLGMNCRDNITLPQLDNMRSNIFVNDEEGLRIYRHYKEMLDIRTPGWQQLAGNLSGGNQQKIVIGKCLAMVPNILILDEPTRGIDIGSKTEIHRLIRELAREGYAIIVISSEMPEVLQVSDRIIAMCQGRITRDFLAAEVTEDGLMQAISSVQTGEALSP